MASYQWQSPVSGNWNQISNWGTSDFPDSPAADVTIDALATTSAYTVTILPTETIHVDSLSLNATNNTAGTNADPYKAAELELDGTLIFAPDSTGTLGGPLQNFVHVSNGDNAAIENASTLNGFFQVEGSLHITGTNPLEFRNDLQALAGTITVDTAGLVNLNDGTLSAGIYDAKSTVDGPDGVIYLGSGASQPFTIGTIVGPSDNTSQWTEIALTGPNSFIFEWDGSAYVPIEDTLSYIGNRATLDAINGQVYSAAELSGTQIVGGQSLTVALGGLLNVDNGTVLADQIDLQGGIAQGAGTIDTASFINNGTLMTVGGQLDVSDVSGTGQIKFDTDTRTGTINPQGATLSLGAVSSGQTITMNGDDTLILPGVTSPTDPDTAFGGTISAQVGDQFILPNLTFTDAVYGDGSLLIDGNGTQVASLSLSGSYQNDHFVVSGDTITVTAGATPTPTPTPAPTPTPTQSDLLVVNSSTGQIIPATGTPYAGSVSGVTNQYATASNLNLNVLTLSPSWFIHTGNGDDGISAFGGTNVLDGGGGSNFITGGAGADTFFVDGRGATADTWSSLNNFHPGDVATPWGVTPNDFTLSWADNQGAPGYTGLTLHASAPHTPNESVTLVGYNMQDLTNGQLTTSYGSSGGIPYMYIQAM